MKLINRRSALGQLGLLAGLPSLFRSTSSFAQAVTASAAEEAFLPGNDEAFAWKHSLPEPLNALVERAWSTHPRIDVATAVAAKARAEFQALQAGHRPLLRLSGAQTTERANGNSATLASFGVEASWTWDYANVKGRLTQAAWLRTNVQELLQLAVWRELACAVVDAALNAVVHTHRLQWARRVERLHVHSHGAFVARQAAGLASLVELRSAQASVHSAQRLVRRVEGELAEATSSLSALTGEGLEQTNSIVAVLAGQGWPTFEQVAPLESRSLLERPDVLAAELTCLAAAEELTASQRAALPTFDLGAVLRLTAAGLLSLATPANALGAVSAALGVDLHDGGRLEAAQKVAKASVRQATADYRAKVHSVLSENAIALARFQLAELEARAAAAAAAQLEQALDAVRIARRAGVVDDLEVARAESLWLDAQEQYMDGQLLRTHLMGRVLSAASRPWLGLRLVFRS